MYPITSNFTLNLGAAQITYPVVGGVAPLAPGVNAIPANWTLVMIRLEQIVQGTNLTTQGPFPAAGLMAMVDYLTMICQQLQEQINRAVLVPVNTPGPSIPVTPPMVLTAGLLQVNGTFAQLSAYAALNPTGQFLGYVSSGDLAGSWFFYTGIVLVGNNGFIAAGGG